jgi:hypothetical protein
MFLNFRLRKWVQSAVDLGHCRSFPATLIAQRVLGVLLFRANWLRDPANDLAVSTQWFGATRHRPSPNFKEFPITLSSSSAC